MSESRYINPLTDFAEKTGEKRGEKKGDKSRAIKVAKLMKKEGDSIDKIMLYTDLTKAEIEKL